MAKGFKYAMKVPEGFIAYALNSVPGDCYETNIRKMRETPMYIGIPKSGRSDQYAPSSALSPDSG